MKNWTREVARFAALAALLAQAVSYAQVQVTERGPAYKAVTPGLSEQEKQWHYDLAARLMASEGKKEREARRAIAALPVAVRQRAVLIAAYRLSQMQQNLTGSHFQNKWAEGVDPQKGTATLLYVSTSALALLASDALMQDAANCHTFEAQRLRKLSMGVTLEPARPCREEAYGAELIDSASAAGDRAVPQEVYLLIDRWSKANVSQSLEHADVNGLFTINAMRK